jgi:DNA-binding winged helix-turn-helix (wHTH) protein
MTTGRFRFDDFCLDTGDRQLVRDGAPVDLNARYFDALVLLVREGGRLVSKDRFLDEVWRGVPVTDEALTQCIKTLRRQLGDDAARPRFIETVPKHGYRFIAPVDGGAVPARPPSDRDWRRFMVTWISGTLGAGLAGLIGGIFYGFAGASQPLQPGVGAISVLLVLVCVTTLVALIGGAGVSFGIAAAGLASRRDWRWTILGGAFGGLVIGAVVKLLGIDAFNLLFGESPGNITGAPAGALLGAAVGLAVWVAARFPGSVRRASAFAAVAGGVAGFLIALIGGRLMGGSLALLAGHFPHSRLRLDDVGGVFGEPGFGPVSQMVTCALEGAVFAACIVGTMLLARRRLERESSFGTALRS